jgi:RNA polymerase nonessential primary-like sigma factor
MDDFRYDSQSLETDAPDAPFEPSFSELAELETESVEELAELRPSNKRTTDLVRMYLQEIGRVQLLGRDEEVDEAQKVQRYMRLLELRIAAAQNGNPIIQRYINVIEARDRLASITSRPKGCGPRNI